MGYGSAPMFTWIYALIVVYILLTYFHVPSAKQ